MNVPQSELNSPGVLCKTPLGNYQITYHAGKNRFTLWHLTETDAEKITTASEINKLYGKIPWK